MASFFSRLGRFSFRRRWLVALLWVVLLVGTGALAGRAPAAPPNDFSMPGTEAQQAYDLLEERFPELNADGATARVVFRAEDGKVTDPEAKEAVQEAVRELGNNPQVAQITDPYTTRSVSKDGSTATASVCMLLARIPATPGPCWRSTAAHRAHDSGRARVLPRSGPWRSCTTGGSPASSSGRAPR
ncbi:MMPL family transporter, partial [Streptomyces sp. NPDC127117]|uniref:MMPL family transporter n=1 Tax=Streptomyces sp. NPDC127117 TaxID=3345368 RepID=UPI00362F8ECE